MSSSISGLSLSNLNQGTLSVDANAASDAAPAARPQPAAHAARDTVKLTEVQQVYQLYNQGQTVSQIATSLSLTEAAVSGYLNLSPTG